jgi:acyl-CoA thioester hydrolase
MDALGHVNNVAYFRYMESARVDVLRRLGVVVLTQPEGMGLILHSAHCRFRRPVKFPDTLSISSVVRTIEADRFTLAHEMRSHATGEIVAHGEGVIVAYDYSRQSKATLPAGWSKALRDLLIADQS